MKRFAFVVAYAIFAIAARPYNLAVDGYYPKSGVVVEIDKQEDIVTVADSMGELWQFDGTEDWQINDRCAMILFDNGTEMIYDDIVVSVRYEG